MNPIPSTEVVVACCRKSVAMRRGLCDRWLLDLRADESLATTWRECDIRFVVRSIRTERLRGREREKRLYKKSGYRSIFSLNYLVEDLRINAYVILWLDDPTSNCGGVNSEGR